MEQTNETPALFGHNKERALELVKAYDKSQGMTIKSYCELHQISQARFYSIRSRSNRHVSAVRPNSGFIALNLPPPIKGPSGLLFAEVGGIKIYQAVPAGYLKALIV